VAADGGVFLPAAGHREIFKLKAGAELAVARISQEVLTLPASATTATIVAEGMGLVPILTMMTNIPTSATLCVFWQVRSREELRLLPEMTQVMNPDVDVTVALEDGSAAKLAQATLFRCLDDNVVDKHVAGNVIDISKSLLVFESANFVNSFRHLAVDGRRFPAISIFTLIF
jgi:hypothetical protein